MKDAVRYLVGPIFAGLLATCFLTGFSSTAQAAFTTVGVYGPNENGVEFNAGPFSGEGTQLKVLGEGTFDEDVAAAFAAGNGGVIDFEDPGGLTDPDPIKGRSPTIDAIFDSGSRNLRVTRPVGVWANQFDGTPVSGTKTLSSFTNLTVAMGQITDVGSGAVLEEQVVQFGFTMLSRDRPAYPITPTVTAKYSLGGTGVIGPETIDLAVGTDDTFFGFRAPEGEYITEVQISGVADWAAMDDMAFITAELAPVEPPEFTPIYVPNYSFEEGRVEGQGSTTIAETPGWNSDGTDSSVVAITNQEGIGWDGHSRLQLLDGSSVYQTLTHTIAADETIRMTFAAWRYPGSNQMQADFYYLDGDSRNLIDSHNTGQLGGIWNEYAFEFTSEEGDAWTGNQLGIEFSVALGNFIRVDNIRVETTGESTSLIPGDANGDGKVTDADAAILATNWQMSSGATWADGDFNEDGKVTDTDAAILATHWQEGVEGRAAPVPEPSMFVLLAMGGLGLVVLRARRRRN